MVSQRQTSAENSQSGSSLPAFIHTTLLQSPGGRANSLSGSARQALFYSEVRSQPLVSAGVGLQGAGSKS